MKKQWTMMLLATTITFGSTTFIPEEAQAASAVIVSSVNLRSAPNTSAASYGYVSTGETVEILSKVNSYWYQVRTSSGKVGYISTSSRYVSTTGTVPASTSTSTTASSGSVTYSSTAVSKVIAAGKAYLGTPYEYGSDRSTTYTFDCSDFVRQAFKDALGVTLPSSSRTQGDYVKSIGKTSTNWHDLKPGDLMFFMSYKGGSAANYPSNKAGQTITHVGIYLGDGKILHTYSKDSGGVRIDSIAGRHWEHRFIFGGSALR
ncbi:C40 family peptidase [Paenibacillus mucilaginosus]|uniref:NLP/P60 family protein n=1 Tax=Paenibacillus mucilaginosus (strain KNP414) TaxID=1036673 RepID=F8FPX9_PAEMK|nr:SH3 domain-containing C40 family peptidase [Paenibacillus mucilaginosus]AEI39121.1 NLP/P60 family protein [Paenibacillus mucilaginosus KNP414]MCG7217235.1 C40 family peptidase [Paenibacillus mucilaginosus]WDM28141.1 C40 family peptidase [Paenibacillus mucilaginosus]